MKIKIFSVVAVLLAAFVLVFSTSCEKEDNLTIEPSEEELVEEIPDPNSVPVDSLFNSENVEAVDLPEVASRSLNGFVITGILVEKFRTVDNWGNPFDRNSNPDLQFRFADSYNNLFRSGKRQKSEKEKNAVPGQYYFFNEKDMPFEMEGLGQAYEIVLFDHDSDRGIGSNSDEMMFRYVMSPALIYIHFGGQVTYFYREYNGYKIHFTGYWY